MIVVVLLEPVVLEYKNVAPVADLCRKLKVHRNLTIHPSPHFGRFSLFPLLHVQFNLYQLTGFETR